MVSYVARPCRYGTYKLLGTVLAANKIEKLRGVINESGPAITLNECGVGEE
tara:strand:- start:1085 stop:1237 length:153 start_codon:yes stop_codon:yes gene_type:complete